MKNKYERILTILECLSFQKDKESKEILRGYLNNSINEILEKMKERQVDGVKTYKNSF